ncbi:MAG TPA: serine/threonine-protein kinase [Myxococcaceae bacterium]|nr:serine/threonine-protein kinase [Myxococcaceae bacterium]
MPPKVIGPYRVLETIGSGGAGSVYRARDRRTGETVALKLLSTGPALDPRAARRLAREFETLAELSHPNVVKVFDSGVFQGYPYLAMELVDGLTLRHYLSLRGDGPSLSDSTQSPAIRPAAGDGRDLWSNSAVSEDSGSLDRARPFDLAKFSLEPPSDEPSFSSGPASLRALADAADEPDTECSMDLDLPYEIPAPEPRAADRAPELNLAELNRPERVGRLKDSMLQLCQALAYIHGHGLIHRDLKPSNVMVDRERLVRLMDFGLAKFLADDGAVTAGGRLAGTFRYMAPEQILGERLDSRSDLYSLGVILYELLSGKAPFDAPTPYELWQKVLETESLPIVALNPGGDSQLARIAQKLIRKEPTERFQTAEEVYEALVE